jgi:hypothetical protein
MIYSYENIGNMRKFILDHYPNADKGYHAKVAKMKYKQVYAICKSLEERDARNKERAKHPTQADIMIMEKDNKKSESQPHQINIFEYLINKQAAEEKFPYEIKEEDDKIFGLVENEWIEFDSEKEYSDYIKEERANI